MKAGARMIIVGITALLAVGVIGEDDLISIVRAQVTGGDFRPALSKAIEAAEKDNFAGMRREELEDLGGNQEIYSCDVLLPGAQSCRLYFSDGIHGLSNFLAWDYGEAKTQDAAERVFGELVGELKAAMPNSWIGQETPTGKLSVRVVREFKASAKSDDDQIGGPLLTILAQRHGEIYRIVVELVAHH